MKKKIIGFLTVKKLATKVVKKKQKNCFLLDCAKVSFEVSREREKTKKN